MKRSIFFFLLFACLAVSAQTAKSQTAARPTSEQSLQELVSEVRQLRATLQRMNAAVYKGQVMLERLKLQQEQVMRIAHELATVREDVTELKAEQDKIKSLMGRVEAGVEAGIRHSSELAELNNAMEQLTQREQRLMVREARLANELEGERAKLNDLNDRLNALVEIEMAPR